VVRTHSDSGQPRPLARVALVGSADLIRSVAQALELLGDVSIHRDMPQATDVDLIVVNGTSARPEGLRRCCSAMRSRGDWTPLVVIVPADTAGFEVGALYEAGADHVVSAPVRPWDFLAHVYALLRRDFLRRRLAAGPAVSFILDPDYQRLTVGCETADLTDTEYAIVRCLILRRERWVSPAKTIETAIGTHHRNTNLVRVHVRHLRKKLGSAAWCLRSERRRGYMFTAVQR
jgi:DNA-binding response OmpR family regulator